MRASSILAWRQVLLAPNYSKLYRNDWKLRILNSLTLKFSLTFCMPSMPNRVEFKAIKLFGFSLQKLTSIVLWTYAHANIINVFTV